MTALTSIMEMVSGKHDFKITGYSLCKGIGTGKYIASDTLMVGGHYWAIHFYPDGKNEDDNAVYVSLFIVLGSEEEQWVKALFELTLVDQSEKGRHKVRRSVENQPYSLKSRGSMWLVLSLCNL